MRTLLVEYGKIAANSMRLYGGKFIARGAPLAVIEGDAPRRLAVVEFPTAEAARAWTASSEFAPAVAIRKHSATTHWIVVMDEIPDHERPNLKGERS